MCDLPASETVDSDGDCWTTCHICGVVYVTPSWAEGPTLSFPTPEVQADRDAALAQLRSERGEHQRDA